jgi:CheY-like chemotaxis protein
VLDQPIILLVDDREDDITIICRAFESARIPTAIQVARDGEEAMAYLSGEGKYSDREEHPWPWLVLLDLKMPRVDGFEVLKWIRSQPGHRSLVVVVLTSSEQVKDVNEAYALGANSFIVKSAEFEDTRSMVRMIHQYWLQWSRRPSAPE